MPPSFRSSRAFRLAPTDGVTFYPRIFGVRGAVASEHYLASQAGIDILKAGGNAVDACVAATLVEGLVDQQMFSLGGEVPMLIGTPNARDIVCINGNTVAASSATPERFRALGYHRIPAEGVLAAGVPAAIGALLEALKRFGRLRFVDVCGPALEYARRGFPAHAGLLRQHKFGITDNVERFCTEWHGTADLYLPENRVPLEGQLIKNPALASMLEFMIAEEREQVTDRDTGLQAAYDAFYRGDIAREICSYVDKHGGLLQRSDFERFTVPVEQSIHLAFAANEVHKCGPWNQGPAMLQALSILKYFDLQGMGHNSATYAHTLVEAVKLAFADREQYYGDPTQVDVPITALLSEDYARLRAKLIGENASTEMRPGDPMRGSALLPRNARLGATTWGPGTVHVAAVDRDGFVAAFTPSGAWIRAAEVVPAVGFPLGTRISNFNLGPAHHPNIVAPFKRPRTTISPSLVTRDGVPWMAFGSMGGDQQDQWQLQFFLNVIVFGMTFQQAIEAPKFSSEHFPGSFAPHDLFLNRLRIESSFGSAVLDALRRRGHDVDEAPAWSEGFLCVAARWPDTGIIEAGVDPRSAKAEIFSAAASAW